MGDAGAGERVGVIRLGVSLKNHQGILKKFMIVTLSVFVILIGAGIFISLFFVRLIIQPLERMTQAAVQFAGGDFRQTITINNEDEVGVLANAFLQMSTGLKGIIKKIQGVSLELNAVTEQMVANTQKVQDGASLQAKATEQTSRSIEKMNSSVIGIAQNISGLSSSAKAVSSSMFEMSSATDQVAGSTSTLSSSVEETASSVMQMSASIKEISRNINVLSSSAEEIISSMTEMTASIKEVGKNAKESALLAEKVSQDASNLGTVSIEQTIEGMNQIKGSVEKSSQVINKLGERTEQIGKILTVIDEVTRQTNLLALNAAILAAQAGNEGKGFSVVADEIKSLADRTGASTKEIAQLIRDIQIETKDAVQSVKEGTQSVERGMELTVNAKKIAPSNS
jgi:methyl-accepting chemotaxis protein